MTGLMSRLADELSGPSVRRGGGFISMWISVPLLLLLPFLLPPPPHRCDPSLTPPETSLKLWVRWSSLIGFFKGTIFFHNVQESDFKVCAAMSGCGGGGRHCKTNQLHGMIYDDGVVLA